jgi:hypothetical protein
MRYSASVLSIFMFAASSGCEHIKPSPDAEAKQRYETYGPKFTEEEKADMTADEKVAVYNAEVRPEDRIICRREKVLGSHFRQERCYTQKELDDAQIAAEQMMRAARGSTVTAPD